MEDTLVIDCRLLEPPEPMVKVLEAVGTLKDGQKICMIHRKKPVPLFARLHEKNMEFEVTEVEDHVEILIWKG